MSEKRRMAKIEVTVKSINYLERYDMYAVEVMFHHERKVSTATLPSIPESLPDDIKGLMQTVLGMAQAAKVNDDALTGTIYLTEDDYNALGRFGVGVQLVIDIGNAD